MSFSLRLTATLAGAALAATLAGSPAAAQAPAPAPPPEAQQAPPALPPVAIPPLAQRPQVVIEAQTGQVLLAVGANTPWHPASLTKMMTVYVALSAVRSGRVARETLLTVSQGAARQPPSRIGLRPGSQISVDAAVYILMVRSANDIAVVLAEGIAGSLPGFVDEMNATSRRLGLNGSVWRNPHGLHDAEQVTTARDMALLARALIRDFPEWQHYWRTPALQWGRATMRNTNALLGRYAGTDGMKTGFICASGFNLAASATRNGRRHIAVVFGEVSGRARAERAAMLLERSWADGGPGFGMFGGGGGERRTVEQLPAPMPGARAPNMREDICTARRGGVPSETEEVDAPGAQQPVLSLNDDANPARAGLPGAVAPNPVAAVERVAQPRVSLLQPVPPQMTAVVLGRSSVNPRERRPIRVGVVGFATVGRGLPLPPAATTAMTIPDGPRRAPRPGEPEQPPPAAAQRPPETRPAAGTPVALVPQPIPRPADAGTARERRPEARRGTPAERRERQRERRRQTREN